MKNGLICVLLFAGGIHAEKKAITLDDVGKRSTAHPVSPVWSPDEKQFAYFEDEKLNVFDIATKSKRELMPISKMSDTAVKVPEPDIFDWTNRRVSESAVQWFASKDRLLVSQGGDLFIVRLDGSGRGSAAFEQLTSTPVREYDPKLSPDNRFVSFRRVHDLCVLEIATKKVTQLTADGSDTLLNAQLDWVYPEELDLGTAHWWSPDSRHIAYLQLDIHAEPMFPQVSLLKPAGVLEPERFPKAGDPNADARLGVVSVEGGPTKWMDLGETRDRLLARVTWFPDSSAVTAMRLNRIQNRLDLVRAEIANGQSEVLIHEEDPYWINVKDEPYFFKDRKEFIWESERDGFRHLYLYGTDGKFKQQITRGEWEVDKLLAVDEAGNRLYYLSNEGTPVENALYETDINGSRRARLTAGAGFHNLTVSPHGEYFTDTVSDLKTPPCETLCDRRGRTIMTWMAIDKTVQDTYALSIPEILQVPAPDGETLYARVVKPIPFDPAKKYPAIVMVYGGPGIQTIQNAWMGPNMEQLYAAHGFVIWQLDNRGSSGRGHKWESAIFRNMGRQELEDQKTGITFLTKLGYTDPARIGLSGWSYGGYMTLYSLVNAPDVFRAGIAGAPVTDWRNYDSIYTERYMGLPGMNKDNYDHSSPQTHAAQLKAKLLIIHSIEDDNVHFSNTLQMADALERADKQFRMLIYPQKTHGVTGEYAKNLRATMLEFFERNLK